MYKSILTLSTTALCAISCLSLAGGDEFMAQPTGFKRHAYAEVMGGYTDTGWKTITGTQLTSTLTLDYTKNDNGGLVWGSDLGYQITSWFAIELGGFKLPTTDVSVVSTDPTFTSPGDIKGSIYYLAGKLSQPIKYNMSLFTKAGVNYQDTNTTDNLSSDSDGINSNTFFGPFFGVGLSYTLKNNLYAKVEYDRASGQANHKDDEYSPNPNIFVAGLGYTFG